MLTMGVPSNRVSYCAAFVAAGVPMVPISWEEMQCPESKSIEKRKVATGSAAATEQKL